MTDIPSIFEGVNLQELIRSSAVSRDRGRRDDFVRDPAEDATRPRTLEELAEERRQVRVQGENAAESFEENVRRANEGDEVAQLVQSLSRLNIEPPAPTAEPVRLPDVDIGAATFSKDPSLNDIANANARERRQALAGTFTDRINEQNITTSIDEQANENVVARATNREIDTQVRENSRSDVVFDSRESVDSPSRSRGELFDLAVREQGDPQSRLVNVEQSINDLISSGSVENFVADNSQSEQRISQEQAVFGARQIEEAISSNQVSSTLRLLDEQQAVAVLNRGSANAVVVGSDVVEGVDDDGRITQTRLEQDNALRTPGSELFFNNEADEDLGNILNGVS